MKKIKFILNIAIFAVVICTLAAMLVFGNDKVISISERRPLTTIEDVKNSENHVFDEIEGYFLDQFPLRDTFRTIKAFLYMDVWAKNDNNGIYKHNGTVVKIEDKLDEAQIEYAANVINKVVEKYFADDNVYYSIIPDKHFYASKENEYPALDYNKMFSIMSQKLEGKQYIDITDKLTLSDYYITDTHWSQDKIVPAAQHIVSTMNPGQNITPEGGFKVNTLTPFYGVYFGQSALSLPHDDINYLTSDMIDSMKMYVFDDSGRKKEYNSVYVPEMFKNKDPYDFFAAGAKHLIIVENPKSTSDKELVVFRDSFGSSIAPLLASGYKKVTFIDLRYIVPDFIKQVSGFGDDADVLFLYSTGLLNGGRILRDFQFSK